MTREQLAIETMTRFAMRRVAARPRRQLLLGGANDRAPAIMDGDVEAQIGGVHVSHLPILKQPRTDRPACGSVARASSRARAGCSAPSRRSSERSQDLQ